MAPEVLRGDVYDHKADVWSLGCLYYEMLTGFPPFTGKSLSNLQENIAKGIYQIPKTIKLSTEGLHFLNSCLKYSPYERLDWEEIKKHPYINHTEYGLQDENYDKQLDEFLYLSTIEVDHSYIIN